MKFSFVWHIKICLRASSAFNMQFQLTYKNIFLKKSQMFAISRKKILRNLWLKILINQLAIKTIKNFLIMQRFIYSDREIHKVVSLFSHYIKKEENMNESIGKNWQMHVLKIKHRMVSEQKRATHDHVHIALSLHILITKFNLTSVIPHFTSLSSCTYFFTACNSHLFTIHTFFFQPYSILSFLFGLQL